MAKDVVSFYKELKVDKQVDRIYESFKQGSVEWQIAIKLKRIRKTTGYKILGCWFDEPFDKMITLMREANINQRHRLYKELDTLHRFIEVGEIKEIEAIKLIIEELSTLEFLAEQE